MKLIGMKRTFLLAICFVLLFPLLIHADDDTTIKFTKPSGVYSVIYTYDHTPQENIPTWFTFALKQVDSNIKYDYVRVIISKNDTHFFESNIINAGTGKATGETVTLPGGNYTLILSFINQGNEIASASFDLKIKPEPFNIIYWIYLPIIILVAAFLIIYFIHKSNS